MTSAKVITSSLYRVQVGHGRGFATVPPPVRVPVHRPARVAVMLALAHKIEGAIVEGRVYDQAEVARRLGLTRGRLTQLLCLLRLAPDLQEQVLCLEATDGIEPLTERDLRPITRERAWTAQRRAFHEWLKTAFLPSRAHTGENG